MFKYPPSAWTSTLLEVNPLLIEAITAAQVPEPEAKVIPAPLSQILTRISDCDLMETNSTLVR